MAAGAPGLRVTVYTLELADATPPELTALTRK